MNRFTAPLFASLLCVSLLFFGLIAPPAQAAEQMAVIPLQHAPSENILPIVQQMVGADGTATAYGNQLIVRASPAKISEVKLLLEELDVPLRNLLISVRTSSDSSSTRSGAGVSGSIGNDNVRLSTDGRYRDRDGATVTVTRRSTAELGGGTQQIRAIEGEPALIANSQDVPRTTQYVDPWGRVVTQTQNESVTTAGLWVTARLQGNQVLLQISHQRGNVSNPNEVKRAGIDTQLRAPLGEWVPLGGVDSNSARTSQSSGYWQTSGKESAQTYIKVDVVGE